MSIRSIRWPAAWLWAALLSLGGCTSAPQTSQLLSAPPESVAGQALIADVPFFPQQAYQCGPAALAMIAGHSGVETNPEQLVPKVYLPAREGSLQPEMLAAGRGFGRLAYRHPPELSALFSAIDRGYPVLVLQNLGLDSLPRWHYAVVIGYDLESRTVTLHSGVTERLQRPMDLFEQSWRRGGYWAFSLLRPDQLPEGLELTRYLQALLELYHSGQEGAADRALATAHKAWPASPLPWMIQGNRFYSSQSFDSAEWAFRRALEKDPTLVAAWNNLAYALHEQGCNLGAQNALSCGLQVNPEAKTLLESLRELGAHDPRPGACSPVTCGTSSSTLPGLARP